ncbi:Cadmium/zinc-transporting ATPase 3-like protein [Melia azedarach]|uniref:Cadmium/zinc-transporting ATPase 3-like protein n=1 Tax=Melia azedarach TaxID=155640 RepID=A0ACC1XCQ5_MELAZ|nr:Cadmium/zinc-transporting ATPase 3-like protein [Melia azedarach]
MAGEELKESKSSDKNKLQKSYFDVLGLCCSSEVPLIENILKSLDGVKEVSVIVPSRTVIVVHDNLIVSQLQIVKALNQARLEANVRANGGTKYQKKWPSPYAIACGILLGISFLKYVFHPMRWFAIAAVAVGIFPIVLKAFASLRNFRLDINLLMLIAVVGTIAMNDYTEAGTIVFLFTIAEWLETRASHKATAVMSSLMSIAPQKAVIAETGEEIDASEVKLNTVLAVKAGEVIPIDGIVVDGECEVDEKTLTGESYPVSKQKDSTVWAGTMNLNGYISVKTTALAEDCVVAKMAKLVEEAQNSKSKTQRLVDKCAQFYTPAVIVISACFAVIPAALRVHNLNHWFHLALVILVSACPCALILSTPVVTFCALTKAATSGLLVKGGDYLEILAKVKVVAFDKTGTITRGEFIVSDFQSVSEDINLNTLLYWVSSIENKSSHPMAAALVEYGRSHSVEPKPEDVEDYQNFPGEGIYGKIGGEGIYIGNRKIAQRAAGCATVPSIKRFKSKGNTIGYIYSGASLVGIFSLSDACRTGAAQAIKELKSLGIRTAMLTGDNQAAAMHAQEQLGNALDFVHSELLPEDKAKIIHQFKQEGKTAMIGDGINDAPALATANIGISMGISGSALATETGNVILMSNDIRKIPEAIQLARKAHWKVIENIILSIATKAAILALAIEGHPLVWAAVLADVGTCLLVIFNSMLLLQRTHKHGGKCSETPSHAHKHGKKCCKPSAKKCKSSDATENKSHGGKCCQSSTESDAHKHGCESNHCQPSHSKQQNCCSDISNAQKPCEPENCFSHGCAPTSDSSSCCATTCGDNQCCSDGNTKEEDRHCDHGSCDKDAHDIEAQKCCNTSICTENTCSKSAEKQGNCGEDHSKSSSCSEECHEVANSAHCHPVHCGEKHVTSHTNAEDSGNDCCGHQPQTSNAIPVLKNCCTDHTVSGSMESMAMSACMSLEKREIGGCCKSYYMKQCCGKHKHFGAGLGGGSFTEIVTE